MKRNIIPALLMALTAMMSMSHAQDEKAETEPQNVQEKLIDAIKNSQDPEELDFKLKRAATAGASSQQVTESRLIWAVVREDFDAAEAFLKPVEEMLPNWKRGEGLLWKKPAHIEAIKHYISAMKAHEKGDEERARQHILDAIWLNPDDERLIQAIATLKPIEIVKVPMDTEIQTADGKTTTLAAQVKGKKALYVQVWATWCGPCIRLLPILESRNRFLPPQGVSVVALNSELGGDDTIGGNLSKAKEVRNKKGLNVPWLIDPRDGASYAQLLELDSVPRALLIDPEGNVIFNDHPVSDELPKALAKIGAKIDTEKELEILAETE